VKSWHDECGVFGVVGHPDAATLTYLGLHALQHRGQESAGIVTSDGQSLHMYKQMGLVADVFTQDVLKTLPGNAGIGHVRYSTAGSSSLQNAQPIRAMFQGGSLALAHNGNLPNCNRLKADLMRRGHIFRSSSDTEVLLHLLSSAEGALLERIGSMMRQAPAAYALVLLTTDSLVGLRDPHGFRPLVLGRLDDAVVVASETNSLDLIGATYEREIEPGEVIVARAGGRIESHKPLPPVEPRRCVFEYIYFARPDSLVFGRVVYGVRKGLGRQLAREQPAPGADLVIPVPDSGVAAAAGYAEGSGLPFDMGLIRSHYVGRTFIEPEQRIRHFGVKLKLNPVSGLLRGKSVVVVDDSIVRGTTSRKIVQMVRGAGAREVHLRISSPPTRWSCFYGIDTPCRDDLIAARIGSLDALATELTADSVGYVSVEGMHGAVSAGNGEGFCDACFTGRYPVPVEEGYSPHADRSRP
jgi:amidophosphoribosyltransferase